MLIRAVLTTLAAAAAFGALVAPAEARKCRKDMVQVGDACIDKYESSVWQTTDKAAIKKIEKGRITDAADLSGVATQRGATTDDYGAGCPDDASTGCVDFYAASIPGVTPSRFVTWFQASAACANSGKRLARNQEWQIAAYGTPDTGGADNGTTDCNTDDLVPGVAATGSRSACVSARGTFDMVGNVYEWVADWVPRPTACPDWGGFSDDQMCLAGASTTTGPGALFRGGTWADGASAGPLAVDGFYPSSWLSFVGFRCARDL